MNTKHYAVKTQDYFSNVRRDVITFLQYNIARGGEVKSIVTYCCQVYHKNMCNAYNSKTAYTYLLNDKRHYEQRQKEICSLNNSQRYKI